MGVLVSFSKAVDLLRLAMMASGRRGVSLLEIEAEFGCVRRTCQRMIEALQQCFPATEHYVGDDGRHYWRLPSRAIAPLLTPSAEELAAMTTAIAELDRDGFSFEAGRMRLLDRKVRALVPPDATARISVDEEALLEAMGHAARPGPRAVLNEAVDEAIATALKGPFHLRIAYQSRAENAPVTRTVAPFGLLLGARRYLVAKDVSKNDGRFRHYRVEDITEAEQLATSFEIPEDFHLADYAQRAFGSFHNDDEFDEVVWRFSAEAADRARRYQFHPAQQLEDLSDGSILVRFKASGQLEMCWHLYAWGDSVEVLSPPSLATLVNDYRRSDFPALP
jgi:predicted DNA-binding transcriptional regulator YafY